MAYVYDYTDRRYHNLALPEPEPPQVVRDVVRQSAPHLNASHVAAGIGVALAVGVGYALSRSKLGQLVLAGAVIWFIWTVNTILATTHAADVAQPHTTQVEPLNPGPSPTPSPTPLATPAIQAQPGYAPRAKPHSKHPRSKARPDFDWNNPDNISR